MSRSLTECNSNSCPAVIHESPDTFLVIGQLVEPDEVAELSHSHQFGVNWSGGERMVRIPASVLLAEVRRLLYKGTGRDEQGFLYPQVDPL